MTLSLVLLARMQSLLLLACHTVLVVVTVPLWIGLLRWMMATMDGARSLPDPASYWRLLRRAWRQPGVRSAAGAQITAVAPWVALAAGLGAALLVPSFTLGMPGGDLSDLLAVGGLLEMGFLALVVVSLAAGLARPGQAGLRTAVRGIMIQPVLLLACAVLGMCLPDGTLAGLVRQAHVADMNIIRVPLALVAGALLLVGVTESSGLDSGPFTIMVEDLAGPDRAVAQYARDLLVVVWMMLARDLVWPESVMEPDILPRSWLVVSIAAAMGLWMLHMLVACGCVAAMQVFIVSGRRQAARRGGLALLCALMAGVLLFAGRGDGLNVLVLLLGMLVILSVSGAGGGGALLWHAALTAACICFSCWMRGQGGMVVPLALVAAGLVGVLAIQMRHAPAVPDGRGGMRLAGGLVCVAVLAQVIVSEGAADVMARLMGLVGLSAIVCGVWAACVTRGVVALCAGLACAVDGMMLLGAQADSIPVIIEALVVAAGLNWVMADLFRDGGGQP